MLKINKFFYRRRYSVKLTNDKCGLLFNIVSCNVSKLSLTYSYIANPSIDSMLAQYFLLYQDVEKFWKMYTHVGILARIVALSRPLYQSPATKKGKCTPCISGGTISRSSLESRIRFLPSSMLAIPAL